MAGFKQGETDLSKVRFLVPLCGKTKDLVFLYEKGFHVIGLEGVEKACLEFFEENNIEFEKVENRPQFPVFQVSFIQIFLPFSLFHPCTVAFGRERSLPILPITAR